MKELNRDIDKIDMAMQRWYNNKTVLVTGGTSGIGKAMVRCLSSMGSHVLFCGRSKDAIDKLEKELNSLSFGKVKGFVIDLSNIGERRTKAEGIFNEHVVDVLINNAGCTHFGDFYNMSEKDILSIMETNQTSVVELTHQFLKHVNGRKNTGVLNVGSIVSFFPVPGNSIYAASKQFIASFTDALHQEMLQHNVHVTGVYPGNVKTSFMERATEGKHNFVPGSCSSEFVAISALKGLAKNKIRIFPRKRKQAKLLLSKIFPLSVLLKKVYKQMQKLY